MSVVGKPGYKETEAGWIPKEWECLSLGELLRAPPEYGANASALDYKEGDIRYLRITDITEDSKLKLSGKKSLPRDVGEKYLLSDGDILLARSGSVGRSLVYRASHGLAAFAGYLLRFRLCDTATVEYVSQYLHSDAYWSWITSAAKIGAQPNINAEQYKTLPLTIPPLPEQQKIAAILTAVDDKLDVIARQIEATQTLKRGLMQTLFSRGVGTQDAQGCWQPHTEFQGSELGEIPTGWVCTSIGNIGELKNGINKSKEDFGHGGKFVNLMDVFGKSVIKAGDFSLVETTEDERINFSLKKGDFLFVRSSVKPSGVGLAALVEEDIPDTVYSGFLIRLRLNVDTVYSHYMKHFLWSNNFREILLSKSTVSANTNINQVALSSLPVVLPSLEEQKKVASILNEVDVKIEKLHSKQWHYQTLKRGLMQKLLTGEWRVKVDSAAEAAKEAVCH